MTKLKFTPFTAARFELLRGALGAEGIHLDGHIGKITDHNADIEYELAPSDGLNDMALNITVNLGPKILFHRFSEEDTCSKITQAVAATAGKV